MPLTIMRGLEIGPGITPCRNTRRMRWEQMDCKLPADIVGLWGIQPIAADDESYDYVYASHTLEHVPWFHIVDALREAHRILRQGGHLEVWAPDFAKIIECYHKRKCGDKWSKWNTERDFMLWVNGRIFAYGPRPMWHSSCFDERHLRQCLENAGFVGVIRLNIKRRSWSHGFIELGMRGTKAINA